MVSNVSVATGIAAGVIVARQAATALAYTRAQLGYIDRAPLYSRLRPGHAVLEVGPGEGWCHRHFPSGLHYTAVDLPSGPGGPARLPVEATAASFTRLVGPWQEVFPALSKRPVPGQFDAVVILVPSAILAGTADEFGLPMRTALRWQRPLGEWQEFARHARTLLRPTGSLLVADVTAEHGVLPRLLLPRSQWRPPLGVTELRAAGFENVEVVRAPAHVWNEPEVLLRATSAGFPTLRGNLRGDR